TGDDIDIDPFLPQPISSTDIDEYASRLGVSDDVRTIMAGLHSEYQEKFRLLETEGAIKAVREAERRHHAMNSQTGEILPPAPEQVDSLYALRRQARSEEHTSELQSRENLVCRLLLEKKNNTEQAWLNQRQPTR